MVKIDKHYYHLRREREREKKKKKNTVFTPSSGPQPGPPPNPGPIHPRHPQHHGALPASPRHRLQDAFQARLEALPHRLQQRLAGAQAGTSVVKNGESLGEK